MWRKSAVGLAGSCKGGTSQCLATVVDQKMEGWEAPCYPSQTAAPAALTSCWAPDFVSF